MIHPKIKYPLYLLLNALILIASAFLMQAISISLGDSFFLADLVFGTFLNYLTATSAITIGLLAVFAGITGVICPLMGITPLGELLNEGDRIISPKGQLHRVLKKDEFVWFWQIYVWRGYTVVGK